jgi:hypothetical protein
MVSSERREEIIAGIVGRLTKMHAGPVDVPALDAKVRETIATLEDVSPKFLARAAIQATHDDAEKIIRTITTLQNQIRNASPECD